VSVSFKSSIEENACDVVTTCIDESLTSQQRYEYRKNRIYRKTR